MSEKKVTAIIRHTSQVLGISLATVAAFAGATSAAWPAAFATFGAIALDTFSPSLIEKLKEKLEEPLVVPLPNTLTGIDAKDWEAVCSSIEKHLKDILQATETQLMEEAQSSLNLTEIDDVAIRILKGQIVTHIPNWFSGNKDLAARAIAKPICEKMSDTWNIIKARVEKKALAQHIQVTFDNIVTLLQQSDEHTRFLQAIRDNTSVLLQQNDAHTRILQDINANVQTLQPKPAPAKKILIASLGESPAVVSSMYDLLTEGKQAGCEPIELDRLVVLQPQEEKEEAAIPVYELVEKALPDLVEAEKLERVPLSYKDVDSEQSACDYLKTLYRLLRQAQKDGDEVYLSLAGGRKSMAAIMAWVVPFFPCVKKLYHVLDRDEDHFPTLEEMYLYMTPAERRQAMHPNLDKLILIDIPIPEQQHISPTLHSHLRRKTADELAQMTDKDRERITFFQTIVHDGKMLNVLVTKHVAEQFQALRTNDPETAYKMKTFFERMQTKTRLQYLDTRLMKIPGKPPVHLHLVEYPRTSVHFAFYTLPKDLYTDPTGEVKRAIICDLDSGKDGKYRTLREIINSPDFSTQPVRRADQLPPVPYMEPRESVLIVPLGNSPMVATQLCTLLEREYHRKIREVVLIYPQGSTTINNAVDMLKEAFLIEEKETGQKVTCRPVPLEGYDDIASRKACSDYQKKIEEVIEEYQNTSPYEIDLALSGGRKGMTAMTIFAAQNRNIPFVYHTLITDDELSEKVERETTGEELQKPGLTDEKRNRRLFLREYEKDGEPSKFTLFRVPVFSNSEQI